MEDIRISENLDFTIKKIGFIQIERPANHLFSYKTGKPLYTFLYVQKGAMRYYFNTLKQTVYVEQDTGIFIPKNLPYQATYLQEATKIKLLSFDTKKNNLLMHFNAPLGLKMPELALIFSSISKQNMHSSLFLSSKISCISIEKEGNMRRFSLTEIVVSFIIKEVCYNLDIFVFIDLF